MSKKDITYPQLGESVRVRDLPDKLRFLLLVHHAIFNDRTFLGDGDDDGFFGRSVLNIAQIKSVTLATLTDCWTALEKDEFRTRSDKIENFLEHGRLNRLIGWAVTPEGYVTQKTLPPSGFFSRRLRSLFVRREPGEFTLVPAGVLYRIARGWRMIPDGVRAIQEETPGAPPWQLARTIRPEHFNFGAYKGRIKDEDTALFNAFCGPVIKSGARPSYYGDSFEQFYNSCLLHYSTKNDRDEWPPRAWDGWKPKGRREFLFEVEGSQPKPGGRVVANKRARRRDVAAWRSSITSEQNTPFRAGFEAQLNADGKLHVRGTVEDPAERLVFNSLSISAKLEGDSEKGFHRPSEDVASDPGVTFAYGLPVQAKLSASGDHTVETILQKGFQLGTVSSPDEPFVLGFEIQAPLVKIGLAGSGSNSNRTPTEIVREYLSSVLAQFEPDWQRRSIVPIYRNGRFDFTDDNNE